MRQIKSKQFFQLHLAAGGEYDGCKRGLGWVTACRCHASGKWCPQQSTTWLPLDFSVLVTMATNTHRQISPEKERGHAVQWLSQAHSRQKRHGLDIVSVPVSPSSIFISISIPFSISISNLHFIVNGPSMATCRITQHGYVT